MVIVVVKEAVKRPRDISLNIVDKYHVNEIKYHLRYYDIEIMLSLAIVKSRVFKRFAALSN